MPKLLKEQKPQSKDAPAPKSKAPARRRKATARQMEAIHRRFVPVAAHHDYEYTLPNLNQMKRNKHYFEAKTLLYF
ncbi:hypothetical protein G6F46_014799 [Rhizopus delemar]|uniref:Uncharacterized protein n=2 Tax=Rhizopus TaxID=4842 RepID=A0A9P6XUJ9_9FUNG|nr:hypothetical protein G6F55_013936 [Rhizopus delemar]KAG1488632.1 hypothetical protein G6F53_013548 [Rhizopus delemar]KAG1529887.1 hypothetical protein G6F51_014011 [Rhizopus arrhizus]KAG1532462.1 hypothetical protein G6F50_016211 [Rhizopus delemar]KAG1586264.1 hypothetical protein G6F46_014799 [Rhizopus delemar]